MSEPSHDAMPREHYARAEQFLPWHAQRRVFHSTVEPHWFENGGGVATERFWYLNRTPRGREFVLVDADKRTRQPAFDHVRLAAQLSVATGKPCEPYRLPFNTFEFCDDGRAIRFQINGRAWYCDLANYDCRDLGEKPTRARNAVVSSDGRWTAFTRDHNLYVRSSATGEERALTNDGERYFDYARTGESNMEHVARVLSGNARPPVLVWSPDSKKLVTHKLDERSVAEMHLVQAVPPDGSARPRLHSYRYPLVGDANVTLAHLVIFDLENQKRIDVDGEPETVTIDTPIEMKRVFWSQDSRRVYFIYKGRGDRFLRLLVTDMQTGATRLRIEENGATQVDSNVKIATVPNVRVLASGEIIWFSERDGWGHLYLYDEEGQLKNQITSGPWVVREILYVDEAQRRIYFSAGGREADRDPYLRHIYRVQLDGTELTILTPEDADHEATQPPDFFELHTKFSPSGRYFVDTYSRVDLPGISVLRDGDGNVVCELEKANVDAVAAMGWRFPEPFRVKARDNVTDIYGVVYRPSHLDPTQKYPVIDAIYPGPQTIRTPKEFPQDVRGAFAYWEPQALAELGFIVVTIDGLGTPYRSKAFHDWSYGNLAEAGGLPDHITGLQQLAARYPYFDLSRVGIYGHSGGGYATVRALLAYPDFYKVGVSSAGAHDNRGYVIFWGEKYQGLLVGDNYQAQDNRTLVANLSGKLLLVWGELDDNVHPALTIRLIDELIKCNKDFDLLVMPNRHHGYVADPYYIRKRWDYFVQHLMGKTPPTGYQIQVPDLKNL